MGNKGSSYAEVFTLLQEQSAKLRGNVIGAYLDYMQFPLAGVIGISKASKYR